MDVMDQSDTLQMKNILKISWNMTYNIKEICQSLGIYIARKVYIAPELLKKPRKVYWQEQYKHLLVVSISSDGKKHLQDQ